MDHLKQSLQLKCLYIHVYVLLRHMCEAESRPISYHKPSMMYHVSVDAFHVGQISVPCIFLEWHRHHPEIKNIVVNLPNLLTLLFYEHFYSLLAVYRRL